MYIILNKYNFCIKALISYSYYSLQLCNYEIINDSNMLTFKIIIFNKYLIKISVINIIYIILFVLISYEQNNL